MARKRLVLVVFAVVGVVGISAWAFSWKQCADRMGVVEEIQAARRGRKFFDENPEPTSTFAARTAIELDLGTVQCRVRLPEVPTASWLENNVAFKLDDSRAFIVFWAPMGKKHTALRMVEEFLPDSLSVPDSWRVECQAMVLKYVENPEMLWDDVTRPSDLSRGAVCGLSRGEFRRRAILEAYRRALSPVGEVWRVRAKDCSGIAYQSKRNEVRVRFVFEQSGRHCEVSVLGPKLSDARVVVDDLMAHMEYVEQAMGDGKALSDSWSYGEPSVRVLK